MSPEAVHSARRRRSASVGWAPSYSTVTVQRALQANDIQRAGPGRDRLGPRQEAPPQPASHQALSHGGERSVLQVNMPHPLPNSPTKLSGSSPARIAWPVSTQAATPGCPARTLLTCRGVARG
jgi:hypothetical protein